eukprot:COSAG02_NODE_2703_length_8201_cov_9.957294_5_plen_64_part_00
MVCFCVFFNVAMHAVGSRRGGTQCTHRAGATARARGARDACARAAPVPVVSRLCDPTESVRRR